MDNRRIFMTSNMKISSVLLPHQLLIFLDSFHGDHSRVFYIKDGSWKENEVEGFVVFSQ